MMRTTMMQRCALAAITLSVVAVLVCGAVAQDNSGTQGVQEMNEAPQVPCSQGLAEPRSFSTERVGFEPTVP